MANKVHYLYASITIVVCVPYTGVRSVSTLKRCWWISFETSCYRWTLKRWPASSWECSLRRKWAWSSRSTRASLTRRCSEYLARWRDLQRYSTTFTWLVVCMRVCACVHLCDSVCTCECGHVCVCVCPCAWTCVCVCACVHVYVSPASLSWY